MTTWVALLRGINVGGHNTVAMGDLRAEMSSAGAESVETYIQSGNVVFDAPAIDGSVEARALVAAAVARSSRVEVPVVVRTAQELARVAEEHPFAGLGLDDKRLMVAFLSDEPDVERSEVIDLEGYTPDRATLQGSEVYLGYPNGSARSKLTNDLLGRRLGVASTMRNWRTVRKLAAMADRA